MLISVPGAGTTSSLYYTDPRYDELAGLVGVDQPGGTFTAEKGGGGHEVGSGITLTWLIHDVTPWRVDRVYLGGDDGPWIATQTAFDSAVWDAPVVWHQPADGADLASLLDRLGLATAVSKDPAFDGVAGAPVDHSEKTTTATPPASPSATDEQGWRGRAAWALGGLLGGALLALGWTRRRATPAAAPLGSRDGADGYTEVLAR